MAVTNPEPVFVINDHESLNDNSLNVVLPETTDCDDKLACISRNINNVKEHMVLDINLNLPPLKHMRSFSYNDMLSSNKQKCRNHGSCSVLDYVENIKGRSQIDNSIVSDNFYNDTLNNAFLLSNNSILSNFSNISIVMTINSTSSLKSNDILNHAFLYSRSLELSDDIKFNKSDDKVEQASSTNIDNSLYVSPNQPEIENSDLIQRFDKLKWQSSDSEISRSTDSEYENYQENYNDSLVDTDSSSDFSDSVFLSEVSVIDTKASEESAQEHSKSNADELSANDYKQTPKLSSFDDGPFVNSSIEILRLRDINTYIPPSKVRSFSDGSFEYINTNTVLDVKMISSTPTLKNKSKYKLQSKKLKKRSLSYPEEINSISNKEARQNLMNIKNKYIIIEPGFSNNSSICINVTNSTPNSVLPQSPIASSTPDAQNCRIENTPLTTNSEAHNFSCNISPLNV